MPRPIFIVGKQRTGTTWLANILCRHSYIVGIQAEKHAGIHESVFFSHVIGICGDLNEEKNFHNFMNMFVKSDYFILSGLKKIYFYKERPKTYQTFFRLLMDRFSEENDAYYWLEKSPDHSLYMNDILKYYPDSKFVGIKRNVVDTIKSSIALHNIKFKYLSIIKYVFSYTQYYKHINHFYRKHPRSILIINYEDMLKSKESIMNKICKFLGITFEAQMLIKKYKPNTSFQSGKDREHILTTTEVYFTKIIYNIFSILPYQIYRLFFYTYNFIFKRRLPSWFYSIINEKLSVNKNNSI